MQIPFFFECSSRHLVFSIADKFRNASRVSSRAFSCLFIVFSYLLFIVSLGTILIGAHRLRGTPAANDVPAHPPVEKSHNDHNPDAPGTGGRSPAPTRETGQARFQPERFVARYFMMIRLRSNGLSPAFANIFQPLFYKIVSKCSSARRRSLHSAVDKMSVADYVIRCCYDRKPGNRFCIDCQRGEYHATAGNAFFLFVPDSVGNNRMLPGDFRTRPGHRRTAAGTHDHPPAPGNYRRDGSGLSA